MKGNDRRSRSRPAEYPLLDLLAHRETAAWKPDDRNGFLCGGTRLDSQASACHAVTGVVYAVVIGRDGALKTVRYDGRARAVPSQRVRNPVPCSPVKSDDRAFYCDESVADHRPPPRLSRIAIFCRPLIAWFSGRRTLSMIFDRWSRRAPRRSASLTASAARNRAPPSVSTGRSGHLAMRVRSIPGVVDVCNRQHTDDRSL